MTDDRDWIDMERIKRAAHAHDREEIQRARVAAQEHLPDGATDPVYGLGLMLAVKAYGDDLDPHLFNEVVRQYSPVAVMDKARTFTAATFEEPPATQGEHAERVAAVIISIFNGHIDPEKRVPVGRGRTLARWRQAKS